MSICFEKLSHEYSPGTPFAFLALKDIDLTFTEGKMTAIIGATGSGKTTLVQHLNGLLLPTAGRVTVNDHVIEAGKKYPKIKDLRKGVGLVFQFAENQLFEETIIKDVSFGPKNFGATEEEARERAVRSLKIVGITEDMFEKSPLELSGGQKRRVAIAGILAMRPRILVLDEPTAGLDPQGAANMMELFKRINKENGITVLIVTHNMEHVLDYCDEVVVLEKGRLLMQTDISTFFENEEYMKKAGIDPPSIVRFKRFLKEKGLELPADVLSIEELAAEIARRYRR
ncbi:MAG: energy-coupling factor transporter ATPase [Erysipelotrichaceae bacterium]|nr:energy-coupling factor transporter ATPase [Erysipelotrichaceae bacterium]